MIIKILIWKVDFDLSFEDRELACSFTFGKKVIFRVEKSFTKNFKCLECNQKVLDEGQLTRFCDDHHLDFVLQWEDSLHNERLS